MTESASLNRIVDAIRRSGLTIYDPLEKRPGLFFSSEQLQALLSRQLPGLDLNYPLRTRSKVLKSRICEILGYPVPTRFLKTKPRFPGQDFDTYVQKSDNLQIWNEEVSPSRRYAVIRVNEKQIVTAVRVVSGEVLAALDTTGTLTQKYQAASRNPVTQSVLVSPRDTDLVQESIRRGDAPPGFLPVARLYDTLRGLTGKTISDPGVGQERNRSAVVHKAVCRMLPRCDFHDTGQFPDVPGQLLELKLQTARTIDLGLVSPDSTHRLADQPAYRHCDVRYAVFYGEVEGTKVRIDSVVVSTGEDFFKFFQRFEGKVVNKKIQIPLPDDFFD
jgi:hypothetical protein